MSNNPFNLEDDAQLNALLDEALLPDSVPGGIPAGLEARILAALPKPLAASQPTELEPVIARIGFFRSATFKRIAAAILVAAGVGIAILGSGVLNNNTPTTPPVAINPDKPVATDLETAIAAVTQPADTFAIPDRAVDTKLDQLREVEIANAVDNWKSVADSLEAELLAIEDNG